jgi:hypothetical protein
MKSHTIESPNVIADAAANPSCIVIGAAAMDKTGTLRIYKREAEKNGIKTEKIIQEPLWLFEKHLLVAQFAINTLHISSHSHIH